MFGCLLTINNKHGQNSEEYDKYTRRKDCGSAYQKQENANKLIEKIWYIIISHM